MAADIIVRVGAAQDRSIDVVFAGIEKKARAAFGVVRDEASKTERATKQLSGRQAGEAKQQALSLVQIEKNRARAALQIERDQYREQSKLLRMSTQEKMRAIREQDRLAATLSRQRASEKQKAIQEEERAERDYNRRLTTMRANAQRESNRALRAADRERLRDSYRQEREIEKLASRTSHRATRFLFPRPEGAIGYAKRIGHDLMRGAGIDFSLSGGVQRAREREDAGMGLAQQERIANGGKSHGGAYWAGKSHEVGSALEVDPAQITQMMRGFTGKTGDFAAMTSHAKELASITLASGANMGEMGSAAGFVYNQLKDMPDAAGLTLEVMRGIVGQTAVGAVEMEEYASQMGRIAANAKMFQGEVPENIRMLSALTQLSIAEGGATSGADAARSIAAFANTTSKGQRINAFKKHGVELFNESGTQKRSILDIIKDSLLASKGNIPAMTQMWADTLGQKPIRGLTNAFNEAGGGEAGWKAALEKIRPFLDAQLDKGTEQKNLADYHATTTAKAQRFQNELDRVSQSLSNDLLPTLQRLAPTALSVSQRFADIVSWSADNPWKAAGAAGGLSVARAGAESLGRMGIDRGVTALANSAQNGAIARFAASPAGMVAGGVGTALGVMAVATASFQITDAILNSVNTTVQQSESARRNASNNAVFEFGKEYSEAKTDEERQAAVKRAKANAHSVEGGRGMWDRLTGDSSVLPNTLAAIDDFAKRADAQREKQTGMAAIQGSNQQSMIGAEIAAIVARELSGQLQKGLNVKVVNSDDFNFGIDKQGPMTPIGGPLTYSQ